MNMIDSYFYKLPEKLIAKEPAKPRERSRLLVFNSAEGKIVDEVFSDLINFLRKGDLLVLNNSKVFPARIFGRKESSGKIEVLLLEEQNGLWSALVGGRARLGEKITFSYDFEAEIVEKNGKEATLFFNKKGIEFWRKIEEIGRTPIPPYIKDSHLSEKELRREYQTVYAGNYGSAAAPTAGLHFSKKQIGDILAFGASVEYLSLNVGLGTFAPLTENNLTEKKLHLEKFHIPSSTMKKITQTKKQKGRIIAVGTTTLRALESASGRILSDRDKTADIFDSTDIFIQPGFKFKVADGLITNFHLPSSSLMMLVAAFIQDKAEVNGCKKLLEIYQYAIKKKYRFYSFGDAMLVF